MNSVSFLLHLAISESGIFTLFLSFHFFFRLKSIGRLKFLDSCSIDVLSFLSIQYFGFISNLFRCRFGLERHAGLFILFIRHYLLFIITLLITRAFKWIIQFLQII